MVSYWYLTEINLQGAEWPIFTVHFLKVSPIERSNEDGKRNDREL